MRIQAMAILTGLWIPASVVAQQPAPTQAITSPVANPADVGSLDAIVKAVYAVISGPQGGQRDWNRMRSMFIPGARLGSAVPRPDGTWGARMGSLEDWIAGAERMFATQHFFETETARTVEEYGHIAHAFSTYESRRAPSDATPFARGINSFQLLFDGNRWWVVTIYWQQEGPGIPIPEKYLPK